MQMKAVLLARGLGSRMKQEGPSTALGAGDAALTPGQAAAAAAGAKGMMPIGAPSTSPGAGPSTLLGAGGRTRPFLDHVLHALADGGCTSVCFVVAPEGAGAEARTA